MSSQPTRRMVVGEPLRFRDTHLDEAEFLDFSNNTMEGDAREEAIQHLDNCERCRQVLGELHRDVEGATRVVDTLLGATLGEYKVLEALSRGGMGAVYRGEHPLIGKKVAIKVLLPAAAEDPEQMHRLLTEARAVNAIRHPNIIDVFSFGELPGGRHYFVMELLDGLPLNEVLRERGKLSAGEVVTVLEQTMSALGAAHASGVIHRDLKPANLFVSTLPDQSWHITVLDFGLAKRVGASSSTSPNLVLGTPGFMAPEQIRGQEVTAATDLYAMGMVAWELLTGDEPWAAESVVELMIKHLEAPLPKLGALSPHTPPELVKLIERMVARKPADRPASALEVQRELQQLRRSFTGRDTMKANAPLMRLSALMKNQPTPPVETVAARPVTRKPAAETRASPLTRARDEAGAPQKISPDTRTLEGSPIPDEVVTAPAAAVTRRRDPLPLFAGIGVLVLALVTGGLWWRREHRADATPPPAEVPSIPAPLPEQPHEEVLAVEPPPDEAPPEQPDEVPPEQPDEAPPERAGATPPDTQPPRRKTTVQPLTAEAVRKKLDQAREVAGKLPNAAMRRMLTAELQTLETRLAGGEAPRTVNAGLKDALSKYGAQ